MGREERRNNNGSDRARRGGRSPAHHRDHRAGTDAEAAEDRGRIAARLLRTVDQLKVLHWETESLAAHLASDRVLEKLPDLVDRFVETMQGAHGRFRLPKRGERDDRDGDHLRDLRTSKELVALLRDFAGWLERDLPRLLHGRAGPDLLNLRDELLALAHLGAYLGSLR